MIADRFVLRLAWREARASAARLAAVGAGVAIGVGALVAVHSFTKNLLREVRAEARALLGADLAVSSAVPYSPRALGLMAELGISAGRGAVETARVTSLSAMAHAPGKGVRLVQLSAVEPGYPFFGNVDTVPRGAWTRLRSEGGAVVDPSLLSALPARVGEEVRIGEASFPILGTVTSLAGDVALRAVFGPRVFIPAGRLEATGLVVTGSRVRYETFFRLPPGTDPQGLADRFRGPLAAERLSIRTVADDQGRLNETLGRLARFLSVVAFLALLLGGLGVGSGVHVFVKHKIETVAVLRCLGAESRRVLAAYLLLILGVGLGGGVMGAALGAALQALLPRLLDEFLPVAVSTIPSFSAMATGVAFGVMVALAFAAIPLLTIRRVAPLQILRRPVEPGCPARDPVLWLARCFLMGALVVLAIFEAGSLARGLAFSAGLGVVLLVLWLAALGLSRALRRFPPRLPYLWRQGVANLHRPANQTVAVVLALGFGTFLLATVVLVRHNLLRDLRPGAPAERPNLVFFDVQKDQREALTALLRARGARAGTAVPVVPMRIASIKGRAVADILGATTSAEETRRKWALRREYRSSYRDLLAASERVLEGRFETSAARGEGPVPVSLERGVARELQVGIGDAIDWDVQGVTVPSRVTSLREVEWARFEPNFFAIFPKGPLEEAPQTFVTLTRLDDARERAALQRDVVAALPNVSVLDVSDLQRTVEGILDRAARAIGFMAFFSLGTGALVLVSALAQSRLERVHEGVLLRALGATRAQLLRTLAAEYAGIGLLAVAVALALAVGAGFALSRFLFEVPFALPLGPLSALIAGVLALTLGIGLGGSGPVFRRSPIELLRAE